MDLVRIDLVFAVPVKVQVAKRTAVSRRTPLAFAGEEG
jgi:hypothetical protein